MPEEKTNVLCPACKTRMSIRQQISYVKPIDTDEFVYHCPMCDAEELCAEVGDGMKG
jgi:Zn finger protein HypA/HybF involved in hydrogenase expression